MGRKLRHQEPGAYYHVVSRGNNKQTIFDDELRVLFLRSLLRVSVAYEWCVLAYALMNNHYHLVLRIGERGLSRGMFQLNHGFARASNIQFDRINHCFGQRFWSAHLALSSSRRIPHSVPDTRAEILLRIAAIQPGRRGRVSAAQSGLTTLTRFSH
jgi:REP element-mobilizing transposase RayT